MPMIRAMRLLNAVEAGTLSGAQLEALLTADPGRLAEFNVLLGMRGQTRRMAASSTAMTAVIASSTAMAAVAASSTAMTAVIASSTAMAAVAASSTAMAAVAASSTAMTAVAASSTAMAAVIASSTAMAAVAASSTAMTAVAASSTAMTAVIASSTAMAAVIASSTAMAAVAASSTAKMAVFNSDTALAAIAASSTALAAMRAATGYVVQSTGVNGSSPIPGLNAGGSYILLGIASNNNPTNSNPISVSTKRAGSARANTGLLIASQSTTPTTTSPVVPLVAPFSAGNASGTGYTWYFGLLRCDV